IELGVLVGLAQPADQDRRRIAVGRDVARRDGDGEALAGSIAGLFHDRAGRRAIFRDIGVVAREAAQLLRRHAPYALWRRQHGRADIALTLGDDVDEGL